MALKNRVLRLHADILIRQVHTILDRSNRSHAVTTNTFFRCHLILKVCNQNGDLTPDTTSLNNERVPYHTIDADF